MGFIGKAIMFKVGRRLWREARKPENQAKAKDLYGRATGGSSKGSPRGRR
jgi:hypothetical protein